MEGAARTIVPAIGASAIAERRRLIAAAMAAGRAGTDMARKFGVSANWARRVVKELMVDPA